MILLNRGPSFIVLFWILLCTHRLRSDKKLVFSDNEVIDSNFND